MEFCQKPWGKRSFFGDLSFQARTLTNVAAENVQLSFKWILFHHGAHSLETLEKKREKKQNQGELQNIYFSVKFCNENKLWDYSL